jgi:hypothetical protein
MVIIRQKKPSLREQVPATHKSKRLSNFVGEAFVPHVRELSNQEKQDLGLIFKLKLLIIKIKETY